MLKTYLYIPEELDKKIKTVAKREKKSKAEVIRVAIEKGLEEIKNEGNAGVEVLFKLAEIGKKYKLEGFTTLLEWTNFCGIKIGTRMNKQITVVVDADAIVAQADSKDPHHAKASEIANNLKAIGAQVIYPRQQPSQKLLLIFKEP